MYIDRIRPGAAFEAGFYAFLGAFAAYLIIAIVVGGILVALGVLTLHR